MRIAQSGMSIRKPPRNPYSVLFRMSEDLHETIRIRPREGAQQHGIDDAEDRRVGANSERERQGRDHRKRGVSGQRANRVSNVLTQSIHRVGLLRVVG